ncbi:hypothetical protein, partial [Stenotrophomonas sp.]|uniref:hypothetical protein n=1 Tax=Stenotrophomonas sp. TaxID=69392 RepID=UPI00289ED55A
MTAYRFYNPAPVLMDLLGLKPCAGGSLTFYQAGTTTPKLTYSDQDMAVPNTNPVQLDSSGRSNTNIWLDGGYSVVLKDAGGATVWTRDVDSGVDDGLVIPGLQSGLFLTNDGSNLLWGDFFRLPDPTGSDGFMVTASAGGYTLTPPPEIPEPASSTATSMKINDQLIQRGTGSISASGTKVASTSIAFPIAYDEAPVVVATIARGSGVVAAGFIGTLGVTPSASGFGVAWDLNIPNNGSEFNLTSPV